MKQKRFELAFKIFFIIVLLFFLLASICFSKQESLSKKPQKQSKVYNRNNNKFMSRSLEIDSKHFPTSNRKSQNELQTIFLQIGQRYLKRGSENFIPIGANEMVVNAYLRTLYLDSGVYNPAIAEAYFSYLQSRKTNLMRIFLDQEDAFSNGFNLEMPLGNFQQNVVKYLDDLFTLAEEYGIYILLEPWNGFWTYNAWQNSAYNIINGGPLNNYTDGRFFTDPVVIEKEKKRIDFVLQRWGNSPYLMGIDIHNEIDIWGGGSSEQKINWAKDMIQYIKQKEFELYGKNRILLTCSTANPNPSGIMGDFIYRSSLLDFATTHMYYNEYNTLTNSVDPAIAFINGIEYQYFQTSAEGGNSPIYRAIKAPQATGTLSLEFDRDDPDYLLTSPVAPVNTLLNGAGQQFTIECFVRFKTTSKQAIFAKSGSNGFPTVIGGITDDGTFNCWLYDTTYHNVGGEIVTPISDHWYHYAIIYNSITAQLYIDGSPVGSAVSFGGLPEQGYLVQQTSGISIDGNLNEWSYVPEIDMSDDPTLLSWGVPNNTNAGVKILWDNTYLYFAYETQDANLVVDDHIENQDDAVDFYLDRLHDGATSPWTNMFYVFKYTPYGEFYAGRGTAPVSAPAYTFNPAWRPSTHNFAVSINGTLNNDSDVDTGWGVEARIAWADLGGLPIGGKKEGFGIATPDDDTLNSGTGTDAGKYNYDLFDLTTFPEIEFVGSPEGSVWSIGANQWNGQIDPNTLADSYIDQIRFNSKALSPTEFLNATTPGGWSTTLAYLEFEEGSDGAIIILDINHDGTYPCPDTSGNGNSLGTSDNRFGVRPYFDSESGPINNWQTVDLALYEKAYHNTCWAHFASGGAGGPIQWPYVLPQLTLTDNMRAVGFAISNFSSNYLKNSFNPHFAKDSVTLNDNNIVYTSSRCADIWMVWLLKKNKIPNNSISLNVNNLSRESEIFNIVFINTYSGSQISSSIIDSYNYSLIIPVPDFEEDLLIFISPKESSSVTYWTLY